MDPLDVERVIHIQRIVRGRIARRNGQELAVQAYRKCTDERSGMAYYCNLLTGSVGWDKPLLLGSADAEWYEATQPPEQDVNAATEKPLAVAGIPAVVPPASMAELLLKREQSAAFQQQCALEREQLMKKHRRKIARAMQKWDQKVLIEKQERRASRLAQLKAENQQKAQELFEGKRKENVETIREAAIRGHVDRIQELLALGFSADAESAMGLTPLFGACQSGEYEAVRILLAHGANVNHTHVQTKRTALMEATGRTSSSIVKELLRYGARLHFRDAHQETAFDNIKESAIQQLLATACEIWSPHSAPVFPNEFRRVMLTFAFIQRSQREDSRQRHQRSRIESITLHRKIQRLAAEAKMQFDQELRVANAQVTIIRKLELRCAADMRYDAQRSSLLRELQDASRARREAERPHALLESDIFLILSFCGRHWFEIDVHNNRLEPRRRKKKRDRTRLSIEPTKRCPPPVLLPREMEDAWEHAQQALEEQRQRLRDAEAQERFDTATGVTRDPQGTSLALLDVVVVCAEHLPFRDPRINEPTDPFVRVFLRSDDAAMPSDRFETERRLAEMFPEWTTAFCFEAVPSIYCELGVQVIDHKRQDVLGEISIPLRSLLDQKEHDEWHVLPPTLRQQLLEKTPRAHAARMRLRLKLTHTKSIVLTRELQQLIKTRETMVKQRREVTQRVLQDYLQRLLPDSAR